MFELRYQPNVYTWEELRNRPYRGPGLAGILAQGAKVPFRRPAGAVPASGPIVDAARFCGELITGEGLVAEGARVTCEAVARGQDVARVCDLLPDVLSGFRGTCRTLVAEAAELVAPGAAVPAGPFAGADPRDAAALREALAYTVEVARRITPAQVARTEAILARGGRTTGGYIRADPDAVFRAAVLPSGASLFFVTSRQSRAYMERLSGVAPQPGDYVQVMQTLTGPGQKLFMYLFRMQAPGVVESRVMHGNPELVPAGTPLPPGFELERAVPGGPRTARAGGGAGLLLLIPILAALAG